MIFLHHCYTDLIGACWDKNPDNRPSFTSIIEKLRQLRHGAGESDDLLHTPTIPEIPASRNNAASISSNVAEILFAYFYLWVS
jgi:hypothetical protein